MAIQYRTEPECCEWLDGKAFPKVSPRQAHALLQFQLGVLLVNAGARSHGKVGTELDAVIGKYDGTGNKLIPDVSFEARDQYIDLSEEDRDEPPYSPAIAAEVWSPGDSKEHLARKIERYLATGSQLVVVVYPEARLVESHTVNDTHQFAVGERFTNESFPWFAFDTAELFNVLDD